MLRLSIFICIILVFKFKLFAHLKPIDITEQTLKIGSLKEKEILFAFCEGDKVILSLEVLNNNTLNEFQILEYPNNARYSDYEVNVLKEKEININQTGAYIFKLKNSSLSKRICKIKIQRIPQNEESIKFNTTIKWEKQEVTTFKSKSKKKFIGNDTSYVKKNRKELIRTEVFEEMIIDKQEKVHSITKIGDKNRTFIKIKMPSNEYTTNYSKELKYYSYWLGVGQEAQNVWRQNVNSFKAMANSATKYLRMGPLSGLAIGVVTYLAIPKGQEDIEYYFIPNITNAELFYNKNTFSYSEKGKGSGAFGKNKAIADTSFYLGLLNDNKIKGVDVDIKIAVVWEEKFYKDRIDTEMKLKPKYEKQIVQIPKIKKQKVPVY